MDGKDGEEEPKTKVLQKAKFVIKFFEEETADQLKSLIEDFDGKVVQQESRCDYILVPLTFEKRRRIGKKEVISCRHLCLFEKSSMSFLSCLHMEFSTELSNIYLLQHGMSIE